MKTKTQKHTPGPSFKVSIKDASLINDIAKRAIRLARKYGIIYDLMTATMDLTACHANGNQLRLQNLLDTDDGNFGHDVFGIRSNINRETGKLDNCFSPRLSLPRKAAITEAEGEVR